MEGASVYTLGLLSFRVLVRVVPAILLHSIIRRQVHGRGPCFLFTTGVERRIVLWPSGKQAPLFLSSRRPTWCDDPELTICVDPAVHYGQDWSLEHRDTSDAGG